MSIKICIYTHIYVLRALGGHHSHTEYVDDHEISEVREALEIKILGILSLFKQFYYTTSTSGKSIYIHMYSEIEA